jgi:hypothetical protein
MFSSSSLKANKQAILRVIFMATIGGSMLWGEMEKSSHLHNGQRGPLELAASLPGGNTSAESGPIRRRASYDPSVAGGPCPLDDGVMWDDWRECVESATGTDFGKHITSLSSPPWRGAAYTAVLLALSQAPAQLGFTLDNTLDNLPVYWRVQVTGGPTALAYVKQHYATEVAAGKVVLTHLGRGDQAAPHEVDAIKTDRRYYDRLEGDVWLFVSTEAAICRRNRHLLESFLGQEEYGWWGAPYRYTRSSYRAPLPRAWTYVYVLGMLEYAS